MTDLGTALESTGRPEGSATVFDLLDRMRPEIERALPATMRDGDRFARLVTTELRRTPKLLECSPESLLGSMMLAAQLGLEPGPLGHVYLVPFKGEVTFVLGYKGMVALAYRSGLLKGISTGTVREGDLFDHRLGTRPFLDHTPVGPPGEREATHYYAVAQTKTGGSPFVVLYPEDVEKARARSSAGKAGVGPWSTDYDAMARKTAVRRLAPMLPQSAIFARAVEQDERPAPLVGDVEIAEVEA